MRLFLFFGATHAIHELSSAAACFDFGLSLAVHTRNTVFFLAA